VLAVADRADHGDLLALRHVRACADAANARENVLYLLLGRIRFHHDHHWGSPFKVRLEA